MYNDLQVQSLSERKHLLLHWRMEEVGGGGAGADWGQLVFIKDKLINCFGLIPITFDHLIN